MSRTAWLVAGGLAVGLGVGALLPLDLTGAARDVDGDGAATTQWACPMLCVVVDGPGTCPVCGMDLEPLEVGDEATVVLDARTAALVGLETETVHATPLVHELRAVGRIAWEEDRVHRVTAQAPLRVEALDVHEPWERVEAGQPLMRVFSADLVATAADLRAGAGGGALGAAAAALFTELVVCEDLMQLFGFTTLVEKEWHRLLTSVQGVGAKASLAIIGALGPEGVSRAIALGDAVAVKRAPGVGPKLAARIVNELKDKAPNVMALGAAAAKVAAPAAELLVEIEASAADPVEPSTESAEESAAASSAAAEADALSALVNLGYPAHDAAAAVASAANASDGASDAAELIKIALKSLATRL